MGAVCLFSQSCTRFLLGASCLQQTADLLVNKMWFAAPEVGIWLMVDVQRGPSLRLFWLLTALPMQVACPCTRAHHVEVVFISMFSLFCEGQGAYSLHSSSARARQRLKFVRKSQDKCSIPYTPQWCCVEPCLPGASLRVETPQ